MVCCHIGGILGAGLHLVAMDWDWAGEGETEVDTEESDLRLKVDKV